jgi:50S ribosomal subunit-associated GTPase HflX
MHEFAAIRETLAECGGSRIETAKRLGISERTLRYRLAKAREQGEQIDQQGEGIGMSGIDGIGGGGAMSVDRVMALRAQILERNTALAAPTTRAGR